MTRRHFFALGPSLAVVGVGVALWLRANAPAQPVTKVFSATGVRKVILRASLSPAAKVFTTNTGEIRVSGLPFGGAKDYHSPDPSWSETPAKDYGLDFMSKRYGSVLVISTKNEIAYIHHNYGLQNISLQVPRGVVVVKEERQLNGDLRPDLGTPAHN